MGTGVGRGRGGGAGSVGTQLVHGERPEGEDLGGFRGGQKTGRTEPRLVTERCGMVPGLVNRDWAGAESDHPVVVPAIAAQDGHEDDRQEQVVDGMDEPAHGQTI